MVGVLIVSHGGFAEALISSLQFLVGKQENMRAVSVWPKQREKEIKDQIRRKIAQELWLNYLALSTVILAVCARFSSAVFCLMRL